MKILAIDTTTQFLCLGAYDGAKFYEYNLRTKTRLSSLLALSLERVLHALDWKPQDIDYFACGLGPGSFTGLRLGLAAIKGLAFSLNKPIVGVPTLDILARNAKNTNNTLIVPMVDAKRNLIYSGIYKGGGKVLKRISPYMLLGADEFIKKIRGIKLKAGQIEILGDAANLFRDKLSLSIGGISILDQDYWYPKAHNIIALALEQIGNRKVSDSFNIKPIYLYPKECQIRPVTSKFVTRN